MTLYGIPNCSTVKKARVWLEQQGIAYDFHDFKKSGISAATLESWLQQVEWEKLVNRAGMTWRGLSEKDKAAVTDAASASTLMQSHTSVIKRPILVKDGAVIAVGYTEPAYAKLFAS